MKIPSKSKNIYPRNEENINAIVDYYFDDIPMGNIDWLLSQNKLATNQIEFIVMQASIHRGLITELMDSKTSSGKYASNFLAYTYDALYNPEAKWKGSKNRQQITRKLREYLNTL
ncbi:MAG: hypothetical protein RJQ00_07245 [Vicingaceae bacterium]